MAAIAGGATAGAQDLSAVEQTMVDPKGVQSQAEESQKQRSAVSDGDADQPVEHQREPAQVAQQRKEETEDEEDENDQKEEQKGTTDEERPADTDAYNTKQASPQDTKDEEGPHFDGDTVTPDPSDFSIRHPLQHTWTMWYDPPKKGHLSAHNWQDSVKKIMDFDTVEDFWCMFNNLAAPDKVAHGCNYHLFKKDVHPSWEDPHNVQGGKWVLVQRDTEILNQLWENSVLAVIGEMFDYPDEVMGVVVSIRKGNSRLALWTRTAAVPAMCQRIGYQWKMLADIPAQVPIEYQVHAEALQTNSSFSNQAMYVV